MIRRPPRSTQSRSSAASDVYKRQHLEQGKPVEQSIMDGANQIVTPAFVSLLCICIVFVPMFFLTGVARFLFVPMAEAVMFAMLWSFILSRTLEPTMMNYLLQPHVHH